MTMESKFTVAAIGVATLGLVACGTVSSMLGTSTTAVNSAVVKGQLFCAIAGQSVPIVAAIIDAADSSAVTVTGKAASWVANVCALVNGIPVSPPTTPSAAPTVAVVVTTVVMASPSTLATPAPTPSK